MRTVLADRQRTEARQARLWRLAALTAVLGLAAGLRFANLAALGYANHYYAAAVKSMLQSWHNLFYLAAEPGASVSVDKPPVGLWLQALSASILGVNGLGLLLPQLLAGCASVAVVEHLVQRWFGTAAGLLAGLALAVTPVAVAIDRNNTMDSTLILVLLLAAWAFVRATEAGRLRYLLVGAALVGVGFNVKMLEAFLPLPAFYGLYLLGSAERLGRKVLHLGLATALLLAIALSWAAAVDLTPASARPYVGSSSDNSVLSLIVGYNGLQRLLGMNGQRGALPFGANWLGAPATWPAPNANGPQPGQGLDGSRPPQGPLPSLPTSRRTGIGQPGLLRLVTPPLSKEMSWLLPLGLAGTVLVALRARLRWPLERRHQAALLWGGWLLAGVALFSIAGFYHEYYLAVIAPPLAALTGIGAAELWHLRAAHPWRAAGILLAAAGATLALQILTAWAFAGTTWWQAVPIALLAGSAALLVAASIEHLRPAIAAGFAGTILALMVVPGIWSALTVQNPTPNQSLPSAYGGTSNEPAVPTGLRVDPALLAYLAPRTRGVTYLLAVPSSMQGADYVLATGRPVLYLGGFMGQDHVVSAEQLARLVAGGQLRYVYWDVWGWGRGAQPELSQWIATHGVAVPGFAAPTRNAGPPDGTGATPLGPVQMRLTLYAFGERR